MSLTAFLLAGHKPRLYGKSTIYRVEDRDPPEPTVEITDDIKDQIKAGAYDHMIGKKTANINAMLACIRNGIDTQPAIRRATDISQGTISIRLAGLEKTGDVTVNRKQVPWRYSVPNAGSNVPERSEGPR